MNRLLKISGVLISLLAMLMANGGHLAVLQSYAWASMFVEFSRQGSVAGALAKTFDGKHPCKLCLKVQECRKREQHKPAIVWTGKLDLLNCPQSSAPSLTSATVETETPFRSSLHDLLVLSPPKPPPRAA